MKLEAVLSAPDFYAKHGNDWPEFEAQHEAGKKKVVRLYARWEELEAIKAASA